MSINALSRLSLLMAARDYLKYRQDQIPHGRMIAIDAYRIRKLIRKLRYLIRHGIVIRRNLATK
jgi:hypothetical protein